MAKTATKAKGNVRHSCATCDWGTPALLLEPARAVLGGIDLDPASSARHNRRVGATTFYRARDRPLDREWNGRVFVNPPGERSGYRVKAFWRHLVGEWTDRRTTEAIWIGFSLEQLQSLQHAEAALVPTDFPLCIPRRRIAYLGGGDQPSHGSFIAYLPPDEAGVTRFREAFGGFGVISEP